MKARARDARIGSLEGRTMPGMHVGGPLHDTFHPAEVKPPVPQGSGTTGSRQPGKGSEGNAILRLRGGGNTQGSGGKGGDRENLLPDEAGSSSHGMYHGTRSGSEAQRAANEAKRYELRSGLERATRDRDAARAARERALAELDRITAAIKVLDAEKAEQQRNSVNPAGLSDIEGRLQTAHADFWQKTREVGDRAKELQKSDDRCRSFESKLNRLGWT
jgi:hypothetical protein